MDTRVLFGNAAAFGTPMLAVVAVGVAVDKNAEPRPAALTGSADLQRAAATLLASGEVKAGPGEVAVLHAPTGVKAERLLLVGLGKAADFSLDRVRKGAGTAVRAAKPRSVRAMAIAFPDAQAPGEALSAVLTARALVEGAAIAEVDWDTYRSDRKDCAVDSLTLPLKRSSTCRQPTMPWAQRRPLRPTARFISPTLPISTSLIFPMVPIGAASRPEAPT